MMSTVRRRAGLGLVAVTLAGLLSACGVGLQSSAQPLPSNAIPAPLPVPSQAPPPTSSPSPAPTASSQPATSYLRLWFVQEGGLAAAESTLPVGSAPELVVQSLAIGPTPDQVATGLRTVARDPLTGLALVSVAVASPTPSLAPSATPAPTTAATGPPPLTPESPSGSVTVILNPAFGALPPVEQVLLLGQVVLSLTGSGESSVSFTDESGNPVAVPLPDGRLLDVPATARDYASLIVRP
jgi:hypothetical protein